MRLFIAQINRIFKDGTIEYFDGKTKKYKKAIVVNTFKNLLHYFSSSVPSDLYGIIIETEEKEPLYSTLHQAIHSKGTVNLSRILPNLCIGIIDLGKIKKQRTTLNNINLITPDYEGVMFPFAGVVQIEDNLLLFVSTSSELKGTVLLKTNQETFSELLQLLFSNPQQELPENNAFLFDTIQELLKHTSHFSSTPSFDFNVSCNSITFSTSTFSISYKYHFKELSDFYLKQFPHFIQIFSLSTDILTVEQLQNIKTVLQGLFKLLLRLNDNFILKEDQINEPDYPEFVELEITEETELKSFYYLLREDYTGLKIEHLPTGQLQTRKLEGSIDLILTENTPITVNIFKKEDFEFVNEEQTNEWKLKDEDTTPYFSFSFTQEKIEMKYEDEENKLKYSYTLTPDNLQIKLEDLNNNKKIYLNFDINNQETVLETNTPINLKSTDKVSIDTTEGTEIELKGDSSQSLMELVRKVWVEQFETYLNSLRTWLSTHTHPDPVSGITGSPTTPPPSFTSPPDKFTKKVKSS